MLGVLSCTRGSGCTRSPSGPPGDVSERDRLMQQWSYVGAGRGDFELHERYGFVGEGHGGWKREVTTTYEGWRFKPQCKAITVVLFSCTIGALLGLAIRKVPGTAEQLEQLRENAEAMLRPQQGEVAQAGTSAGAAAPMTPFAATEASSSTSAAPQAAGKQPFDCDEGAAGWRHGWSVGKMDWCCQQANIGCREGKDSTHFDCEVGPVSLWVDAKAKYCCKTRNLGCPTLAPPKRVFDCEDVPKEGREAWPAAKRAFCESHEQQERLQASHKSMDCSAAQADGWDMHQRAWCCEFKKIGCPGGQKLAPAPQSSSPRPPHAATTLAPSTAAPEPAEEHDCSKHLRQWVTAWTPDKKAWCCRHKKVACPPDPTAMGDVP